MAIRYGLYMCMVSCAPFNANLYEKFGETMSVWCIFERHVLGTEQLLYPNGSVILILSFVGLAQLIVRRHLFLAKLCGKKFNRSLALSEATKINTRISLEKMRTLLCDDVCMWTNNKNAREKKFK